MPQLIPCLRDSPTAPGTSSCLRQEEARRLHHNYIGTEHILLGLFGEPEGLGLRALAGLRDVA